MRIALVTPLFPPDNTSSAQYVKTLCVHLCQDHEIDLFLYTQIPESIKNITLFHVNKRNLLPVRLLHFTYTLIRHARKCDVLLVQNGPSVELPVLLFSFVSRTPIIFTISDHRAILSKFPFYIYLHRVLKKRVSVVFIDNTTTHIPPSKPEIIPFESYPEKQFAQYADAWKKHLHDLNTHFNHV